MSNWRFVRTARVIVFCYAAMYGSLTLLGCGLSDIRDSLVDGALNGVQGATTNWVDSFILDLNELIDPFPDQPLIDTP
jgi:hypothetical protein